MEPEFYLIGHRGTRTDFDENSLIAFEKAMEAGANYIEFDVRKSKDDEIIVLHDSTIDRTANGSGRLKEMSLSEIKSYKLKLNEGEILLLSEVLDAFKNKIKFIIDLKEEKIESRVLELVNSRDLLKDCVFSGRNFNELVNIKASFPESKTCYNITKGKGLSLSEFVVSGTIEKLPFKIDFISLRSSTITPEFINVCQKHHIKALSWDFLGYENPLKEIISLINIGIDGILFDDHKNISTIKHWINRKS
jgi:glycerophosphoryl diester phosphodiesterase